MIFFRDGMMRILFLNSRECLLKRIMTAKVRMNNQISKRANHLFSTNGCLVINASISPRISSTHPTTESNHETSINCISRPYYRCQTPPTLHHLSLIFPHEIRTRRLLHRRPLHQTQPNRTLGRCPQPSS